MVARDKVFMMRLSEKELDAVKARAAELDRPAAWVFRTAVREYLAKP